MAQTSYTVSGVIRDTTGQSVTATNIWLIASKDTLHTTSNETGNFNFTNVHQSTFILRADRLGYETWHKQFMFPKTSTQIDLPLITLITKTNTLKEVVIKGKRMPVVINGDTIEYLVDQYKLRENAVIEDLLKRLPGLEVDRDGNVNVMGKPIIKLRINGKDFLVDDIKNLTRLLPIDLINKIQLIDDYGDMARATGRKTGEPEKIINIQTKTDLNKIYQAQAIAGTGNDRRYNAAVLTNYFSEQQQFSLNGNTNNTSGQIGNLVTTKGNINYRGNFSKALSINAALQVRNTTNNLQAYSNVKTETNEGTLYSINSSSNNSMNDNYNLAAGGEYKPREADMIKFNLYYNLNNAVNNSSLLALQSGFQHKDQATISNITSRSPTLMSGLFGTHRFNKFGRVASFGLVVNYTRNNNDQDSRDDLRYYNANSSVAKDSLVHLLLNKMDNTFMTNAQISWIEPLDSISNVELRYVWNYTSTGNKQETQWISPDEKREFLDSLSNQYAYTVLQHQVEFNYRKNNGKIDYTIGVRLLPSSFRSNIISERRMMLHSTSMVPVFRIQYKLSNSKILTLAYTGNVTFPTNQQLQPIADLSNAQFPVVGNPNLKPSLAHTLFLNYRNASMNTLFINLSGNYTQDKVISNIVLVKDSFNTVKQETHFLNANGDYNCRFGYGWSQQVSDGKYSIFLDGNSSYSNNVLYIDNEKKIAQNLAITQSLRANRLGNVLELTGGVSYTYNRNVYDLSENNITNLNIWTFNIEGKLYFLKTFLLAVDLNKQLNSGYSNNVSINPFMINCTLEKTFYKRKFTCRLQGYNLLNETSRLSQSISVNSVTENRSSLIGRYFMLSLQCDLRMFKGK
ncbi:TonB-dependent receptor [Chitinophaga sp. YR573]|uniref:TonB-dependent receptor n=1 Tax=Chitinophaga sp. YR573 TaxID=1881040 RepID=UPI0015A65783|nr:TonB-dependent receptor [Chitinophaga sp. YR573]